MTDIAVVGAGPVGMTVAALLAARGKSVVVLERNAGTSDEPKAISIDDEALRICQAAGLAERILGIVIPGIGTRYYDAAGRPVFQASAARPYRLGHPFKNPFAQPDLERELYDHLRGRPEVEVRLRTEVVGLAQDAAGVTVRCSGPAGSSTVRARFLLGCDGGRSTVRDLLGIGMTGRSFDEVWLVVDVTGDHHRERYGMHHGDPDRPYVIVPGRDGRCRYEFRLLPGEGEAGSTPSFELVRSLLGTFRDITPDQVERAVNYRFNALVADRWRAGRAFLLGDAAHMMPPFAGQGLNSGLRDAANLAWKLAEVLSGRLDDAALDTYEQERRPHAEATVRLSRRLGRIVMTTNPRLAAARDRLVGRALQTPEGRAYFEQMRYRPAHAYSNGLVVPSTVAPVGVALGQPRAFDVLEHRTRLLDEIIGTGWALLGVGIQAAQLATARQLTAPVEPTDALVAVDDRMADHQPGLRTLIDVDDALDAEFAPYHGRLVLLRPDRFVAATWLPDEPPADLSARLHWARPTLPVPVAG
jgi:3-(3-hydroxy-phenyl)propionate hydroxylase